MAKGKNKSAGKQSMSSSNGKKSGNKQVTQKSKKGVGGQLNRSSVAGQGLGVTTSTKHPTSYLTSKGGPNGSVIMEGCECISEINTSATFAPLVSQPMNPGNQLLHPRLSQACSPYEKFRYRKFKVKYVRGCQSSVSGTAMTVFQYDAIAASPPSAIEALANASSVPSSYWESHECQFDCAKAPELRYITPVNVFGVGSTSLSVAELRQDYPGWLFVFGDKGPTTAVFAGYVYVEYEVEVHILKPPTPISFACSNVSTSPATIGKVSNTGVGLPAQNVESSAGIYPRIEAGTTTTYASKGGINNLVDGAKAIYDGGTYLYDLLTNYTTASVSVSESVGSTSSVPRPFHWSTDDSKSLFCDLEHRLEEKKTKKHVLLLSEPSVQVSEGRHVRVQGDAVEAYKRGDLIVDGKRVPAPNASGDVTLGLYVYNVTPPNAIDPDFPCSSNNMTKFSPDLSVVSTVSAGTGGTSSQVSASVAIPTGSQAMIQPNFATGATTGRTLSGWSFTANAASEVEI